MLLHTVEACLRLLSRTLASDVRKSVPGVFAPEWQLRQILIFSSFIENNDIWALSKFTFRGLKSLTHL